jgi:hypothetical protein
VEGCFASIVGACVVALSAALSAAQSPEVLPPDATAQPFRAHVLAAGERTSLVIELERAPGHVRYDRIDSSNGVLEIGPITRAVPPRELKAGSAVPLLVSVAIRPASSAVRFHLNFLAGSRATVRTMGRRVYVDLAAAPTPTPAPTTSPAPAPVPAPAAQTAGRGQPADDLSSLGYDELPTSVAETAAALAKRPDIKGLLALRVRVVVRDNELGRRAPDLVGAVLANLDQRLDEARRLRLKMDAAEFERAGRGSRK